MQKIIEPMFSPEDHYEALDAQLTEVFRHLGVTLDERAMELMIGYNRLLRNALGLPVTFSS